jgi:hypothetical protein
MKNLNYRRSNSDDHHTWGKAVALFGIAVILFLLSGAVRAQGSPANPWRSRIGVTVGSPQTIAITYEYAVASPLQLQVNAGTVIVYSSVSGRVLVVPDTWRLQPYAFVGGGLLHSANFEQMDGDGWTGFTWFGGGLRLRIDRFLLFGELGSIDNLNESKEFESHYSTVAIGILVAF